MTRPIDDRFRRLFREIEAACKECADPKVAAKYARYFAEGYDAYGIKHNHPTWQKRKETWFATHRDLGLKGFLEFGRELFATGKYEHGALAIWFVPQFRDQLGPRAVAGIGKWFEGGVRYWAHSDVICAELLSPCMESGAAGLTTLASWRKSPHKFKRRAVPVAMLGLLKRVDDPHPLLEFLRPMMLDREKVVQQGLGWFLREAWKRYRKPVEAFLLEWKDTAPRLIFQYATEKMADSDRQRFRKAR